MSVLSKAIEDDVQSCSLHNSRRAFQVGYMQGWQKGKREALLHGILVNLQIKYGDAGQDAFPEISEIRDIGMLMSILEMIRIADSPQNLLFLRQSWIEL